MAAPRVVVVGGGIIGLTSALALLQSGFRDVRVVAASFDDTTSHVAAAIWLPFALPDHVDRRRVTRWCEESVAWLDTLHKAYGERLGIHRIRGVEVAAGNNEHGELPYWAHCVKDFRQLSVHEAAAVAPRMKCGETFETFLYKPEPMMKWLREQIATLGGRFETRFLCSIEDITDCDLVVNCTGLGAKEFVGDDSVYPVRGQVIRVYNPCITRFTIIAHDDGTHTYLLPRLHGEVVVGGTVQPHNWNLANDSDDIKGIWERACAAIPEMTESTILGEHCGLRPQRELGVRLEVDPRRSASGALVVHNYGHSGSGHTLQWGCAMDVVRLATKHFLQSRM